MSIALFPTVCLVVIIVESWNRGGGPTHPGNRCCTKPRKPKEKVSVWWNCVSLGSREERPKPMCFEEKARENPVLRIPPRTLKNSFLLLHNSTQTYNSTLFTYRLSLPLPLTRNRAATALLVFKPDLYLVRIVVMFRGSTTPNRMGCGCCCCGTIVVLCCGLDPNTDDKGDDKEEEEEQDNRVEKAWR